MNKYLIRRRDLFWYFGLGISTTALSCGLKKTINSSSVASNTFNSFSIANRPNGDLLPEFQGIDLWLNSAPLKITELKGNVILVQFWTFACINCQRTLPYIIRWHRQYAKSGLRVIGIHTPEFAFERNTNNVKRALERYQITYPVALDNEYKTWNAYENNYWPHLFLADRQGFKHYNHIGEGSYDETEQVIRRLLG